MNKIAKYLSQYTIGAVYSSPAILEAYSTDQSILKITPKIVTLPTCTNDIRKIVNFSYQLVNKNIKMPITVRYSNQSKTGSVLGNGIIISMEKMDEVEEIDPNQRLVRLQTGARLDTVQNTLALYGLYLPFEGNPDQTIGDLISEHITLNRSTKSGDTILHYIPQAEVVLSNGEVIHAEPIGQRQFDKKKHDKTLEAKIYRELGTLIKNNTDNIKKIPDYHHDRTGYGTLSQVFSKNRFNILPLFFGSENSLGVVTEIILRCELLSDLPQYCVVGCQSIDMVNKYATAILSLSPTALDLYDISVMSNAESTGRKLHLWRNLPKDGYLLVAQFRDINTIKRNQKIKQIKKLVPSNKHIAISDAMNYQDFIELESAISSYCNNSNDTILPILDGAYIPNIKLIGFLEALKPLVEKNKMETPFYGSLLHESFTVRPAASLNTKENRQRVLSFMNEYNKLVHEYGGNLAGDCAEGRLKGIFVNQYIDKDLKAIYKQIRDIFDPRGIMNPGIKQGATPKSVVKELRNSYNIGIIDR